MINFIAMITMFIDHLGVVFFPDIIIFRIIGRLSFPLFAYGITKGYKLTRNFNHYAARLIILAIISQIPYDLLFENKCINVCFTLFVGLIVLKIYDSNIKKILKIISIMGLMILAQVLNFEYGFYGILTIFIFYIFWEQEKVLYYQSLITLMSLVFLRYDAIQLISIFSTFIILFLNLLQKKDFKINKVFRYGFYPIHLVVLFLIKIGGV